MSKQSKAKRDARKKKEPARPIRRLGSTLRPHARLVDAAKPPTADVYWTVVRTFSVLGDAEAARVWAAKARMVFPSDPRFR